MQYLILMRGAPGSGKSTWIRDNHLENYTLCPDDLRVYVQSPDIDIYGNTFISQKNDHFVWDLLFQLLEKRMEKGELTVIDGTHSHLKLINQYRTLCDRYRYRCVVVEMPNDIETILRQNKDRGYKFVPEDAIANHVARINAEKSPAWCKAIKWNEWSNFIDPNFILFDFNQWKDIYVFGDIHGCVEPLNEFFSKYPFSEETFYIFTGDYFDRGIQNAEVFALLEPMLELKNTLFLRGNHEYHLWDYGLDGKAYSDEFNGVTLPQFKVAGITPSRVRSFYRKLGQMAYFKFDGNIYFICHGGIPVYPNIFVSSHNLSKGVGKYEDTEEVEKSWAKNTSDYMYQIHGHRNIDNLPVYNEQTRCFNLEGKIEYGGNLRIVHLMKE